MQKEIFAICDSDVRYATKIYEYINSRQSDKYDVYLYTDRKDLDAALFNKNIAILLISEDECTDGETFPNVAHTMILQSKEYTGESYLQDSIYKFQSGDSLLREVMGYCAKKDSISVRRKSMAPLKVIGIYSPIKRCFQTTFAVTLGQILAASAKSLYLNFECFSGFDKLRVANGPDMLDLVYYLSCNEETFSYRVGSTVLGIGPLDYVPPSRSYMGCRMVSAQMWLKLIAAVEEFTEYEYLILDLSENITGLFDILRACDLVYTIVSDGDVAVAKLYQYELLLSDCAYGDILDKTKRIRIPMFRRIPEEFEMLPYSELSNFVKGLIKSEDPTAAMIYKEIHV